MKLHQYLSTIFIFYFKRPKDSLCQVAGFNKAPYIDVQRSTLKHFSLLENLCETRGIEISNLIVPIPLLCAKTHTFDP